MRLRSRRRHADVAQFTGEPITPANHQAETHFIKQLQTISALVDRPTRMFVTAAHWGQIADEVVRQYRSALANPGVLPSRKNFASMIVGNLAVINSGTEDEATVNELNRIEESGLNFQAKRRALQSGRN